MLVLPIKRKWFDMIKSGEKKEEYREMKSYYYSRFLKYERKYDLITKSYYSPEFVVIFKNGYSYKSPQIQCKCKLKIGQGKEEWGAEPGKEYYILDILQVYPFEVYRSCENPIFKE